MDKEELLSNLSKIGTTEDEVERRTLITGITENINTLYDDYDLRQTTIDTLNNQITENKEKIQKLQEANMDFYLKLNAQKSPAQQNEGSTGIKDPEPNKRKFEDLFKGGN